MKLNTKIFAGVVALTFSSLAAGNLQAQVPSIITITGTEVLQGDSTDSGTITITPAPARHTLTTKEILEILAKDEHAAGHYTSNIPSTPDTFPSGAKLMAIISNSQTVFQVVDKNNNLLVDVSDIVSISSGGVDGTYIESGKENDSTGLPSPTRTIVNILTFSFDDSKIAGRVGLKFYMTGTVSGTTADTAPNPTTKTYTETKSFKMSNAVGEGNYQGRSFVVTGSLSGSGKATLTLP